MLKEPARRVHCLEEDAGAEAGQVKSIIHPRLADRLLRGALKMTDGL